MTTVFSRARRFVRRLRPGRSSVSQQVAYERRVEETSSVELREQRDVLLVVIDCLRYDHTCEAGYERPTTPWLDDFDADVHECVSAAPWTFPSVPSMLTGCYPSTNGVGFTEDYHHWTGDEDELGGLRDGVPTLGELLGCQGYATYLLTGIPTAAVPLSGRFERIDRDMHAPADDLVDRFVDWWVRHDGEPRFGYLHLGDLHGLQSRGDDEPLLPSDDRPFGSFDVDVLDVDWRDPDQRERHLLDLVRLYDTCLHFVDRQLRRLVSSLRDRGDLEDAILVITSDHGEAFGEHAEFERENFTYPRDRHWGFGHGENVFQETVGVPLVAHGVDVSEERGMASGTDVVPTILSALGADRDFVSALDGAPLATTSPDRPVLTEQVSQGYEQKAAFDGRHKLLVSAGNDLRVLFDLAEDPTETNPLDPDEHEEVARRLAESLPRARRSGATVDLDRDTEDALRNLGYIE